ncbi:MAG: LysE family translocator [Paracoccaceae bacterium]
MTYDVISALVLFAFVSSITPGPNNLMLMASGANFGLRRTVPHMLGIAGGFIAMILLVGAGLAQVFLVYPVANTVLKVCSVLYMLYLAWRIATAGAVKSGKTEGTPMTFWQAAAFQWVNPKAWAMALTATTVYMPEPSAFALVIVALVFGSINLPAVGSWTIIGQQMARILTNPRHLTVFNWTMAGLLVLSLIPVLWTG